MIEADHQPHIRRQADEREQQEQHEFAQTFVFATDPVMEDHRQVDQAKGQECAEVDERGRGGDVQFQCQQSHHCAQQDAVDRRAEAFVQGAEKRLRQYAVAAHGVQQSRPAGLG
ncbi:hypothetical protein D3C79_946100 [compost metagenome]